MCVVSMVMDHYQDRWFPKPQPGPFIDGNAILIADLQKKLNEQNSLIEKLTREFEEMKSLLERAQKYDADNNEPDCEVDEKVQLMLKLAELLGVDPGDVLKGHAK